MTAPRRSVLITGAASGIGAAVSRVFAAEGHAVAALDVSEAGLSELAHRLAAAPGSLHTVVADVRDRQGCSSAIRRAADALGGFDAVCVNAAVGVPDRPLVDTDDGAIDELIDINLRGAIVTAKAAIPHVHDEGAIVFTSSISGLAAHVGGAAYGATKIALVGLMRSLAAELAPRVRVNAVCPGGVDTPMLRANYADTLEDTIAGYLPAIPLGRIAQPEDVATAIAFLASPGSRHITGVALRVDGGEGVAGVL